MATIGELMSGTSQPASSYEIIVTAVVVVIGITVSTVLGHQLLTNKALRALNRPLSMFYFAGSILLQTSSLLALAPETAQTARLVLVVGYSLAVGSTFLKAHILQRIFFSKTIVQSQKKTRYPRTKVGVYTLFNLGLWCAVEFASLFLFWVWFAFNMLVLAWLAVKAVRLQDLMAQHNEFVGIIASCAVYSACFLLHPFLQRTPLYSFANTTATVLLFWPPCHHILTVIPSQLGSHPVDIMFATAASGHADTSTAIERALTQLTKKMSTQHKNASFIQCLCTCTHDIDVIRAAIAKAFPGVPLIGATSCQGVMTDEGIVSSKGTGLGLLAVSDPEGQYTVISCTTVRQTPTAHNLRAAFKEGLHTVTDPVLTLLHPSPGMEELVMGAFEATCEGSRIIGGTAADNSIEGNWSVFTNDAIGNKGFVGMLMRPSVHVHQSFYNGYSPTRNNGKVTEAREREIISIDGKPAAEVYNTWAGGGFAKELADEGNILGSSSLCPMGVEFSQGLLDENVYKCVHPAHITKENTIKVFADVTKGQEITMMAGTEKNLVSRVAMVGQTVVKEAGFALSEIKGAMVIYCAGCMLTIQNKDLLLRTMATTLRQCLGGAPFLGMFPFGEQGTFKNGECTHANLMFSVAVFSSRAAEGRARESHFMIRLPSTKPGLGAPKAKKAFTFGRVNKGLSRSAGLPTVTPV